jgi:hypothetical protein
VPPEGDRLFCHVGAKSGSPTCEEPTTNWFLLPAAASIVVGRLALLGRRAERFSPATNPDWSYGEGMTEQSPAITVSHPPAAILRIVNPILGFLLRTPVMGAARKQLMVVSFNGRKTGRQYTIPLSAHRPALVCKPTRKGIRQAC